MKNKLQKSKSESVWIESYLYRNSEKKFEMAFFVCRNSTWMTPGTCYLTAGRPPPPLVVLETIFTFFLVRIATKNKTSHLLMLAFVRRCTVSVMRSNRTPWTRVKFANARQPTMALRRCPVASGPVHHWPTAPGLAFASPGLELAVHTVPMILRVTMATAWQP